MSSRGPDLEVLQQPVAPAVRQRPSPGQPRRFRRGERAYQPPSPADICATVPVTGIPVRAPRVPSPRVIDLDSVESQDTEPLATPGRRDRLSRLIRLGRGPSKRWAYELGLRQRVTAPVGSTFTIAVVNLKGGVGKTAVVEALGSTFAEARDDRVIAVDIDAGDLIDRHGQGNRSVARYQDVGAQAYRNSSGLEVLGQREYANSVWRLERDDVVKALSLLRNHYSVVLVDCGNALKSDVAEAVLSKAHALAIVTDASVDAIRKTRITLDWLADNGYDDLLRSTMLTINRTEQVKPNALADKELGQLVRHFAAKRVVTLPFDPHVREGKEIILARMSKESRQGYLELAAALADMFPANLAG